MRSWKSTTDERVPTYVLNNVHSNLTAMFATQSTLTSSRSHASCIQDSTLPLCKNRLLLFAGASSGRLAGPHLLVAIEWQRREEPWPVWYSRTRADAVSALRRSFVPATWPFAPATGLYRSLIVQQLGPANVSRIVHVTQKQVRFNCR